MDRHASPPEANQPQRSLWTDGRLVAWTFFELATSPLLLLSKVKRHFQGYVAEFDSRRWKIDREALPPDPRIVFVGAGPGELIMMDRLTAILRRERPDASVTVCLRDLAALDRLRQERPDDRFTVWPFDFIVPVGRWLRMEKPHLVVFVDRFRFTTLACGAARFGAPLALVNGRSRKRESFFYRLAEPYYRWQVAGFQAMAMEDLRSAEAIARFASANCLVEATGSIKADFGETGPLESNASLSLWLTSETPLVAAGSTRDLEEEAMILTAFQNLRKTVPCRLLIAPRSLKRVSELRLLIESKGLTVSQRSLGAPPAEVYLLDTFGELAFAYGHAQAAYIGGSYTKGGGGHNVMEPLRWGVPVAYGMLRGNFASLQQLCESRGVATRIDSEAALEAYWSRFLQDSAERQRVGQLGRKLIEESAGAAERTVEMLLSLLPPPKVRN